MDIDFNEIMAYLNDHCDYYKMTEKYMPQGIAKYVKNVRLDEAKNLLINTDMSVKKIADKVGYNDYNYFGKDFKKTFGISTKKIRQSIKKQFCKCRCLQNCFNLYFIFLLQLLHRHQEGVKLFLARLFASGR